MGVTLRIDVDAADTERHLESMMLRASNFRGVFWYARQELEAANAENFTAHGLPSGGWAPRTQVYAWPIMRRTGALFSSLTSLRGAPNDIGRTAATFGTNVEYAQYHQRGTFKMPKRLVVFEPFGFGERVGMVAAEYVAEGVLPG